MSKIFIILFSFFMMFPNLVFPTLYFPPEVVYFRPKTLLKDITEEIEGGMDPGRIRVIFSFDGITPPSEKLIDFIQKSQEKNVCLIASSEQNFEKTLEEIENLRLSEAFQTQDAYKNKIKSFVARDFHVVKQGHLICVREGCENPDNTFPNTFFSSIFAETAIPSWVIFFENSPESVENFNKDYESVCQGNPFAKAFQDMPITIVKQSLP